jgi:phospholipase C
MTTGAVHTTTFSHPPSTGSARLSPALLVSPYAKPGTVEHSTLDFTSILKFVETNWQLRPLARRDRTAGSIAGAFDFSAPPRSPILLGNSGNAGLPRSRTAVAYFAYGLSLAVFTLILALSVRSAAGQPADD